MNKLSYWYYSQPKAARKQFKSDVIKKCGRLSGASFYRYLGDQHAPELVCGVFSELTGIPTNELYLKA